MICLLLFENIDFNLFIFHKGKLRLRMMNEFVKGHTSSSGRAQTVLFKGPSLPRLMEGGFYSKEPPIDLSSGTILPVAFSIENILELSAHISQPCNLPFHTNISTHQASSFGTSLLHILLLPHMEHQNLPAWSGSRCQKSR